MPRPAISTRVFALVVVRKQERFLLVHELKRGQPWYLPAGRVEPGETIVNAARRETLEETGIPVELDGILRIEYSPHPDGTARLRVFFLAHPMDDRSPKQRPDQESLGAAWVTLRELDDYKLRRPEVRDAIAHVSQGGPVYPLSLLCSEGLPWADS